MEGEIEWGTVENSSPENGKLGEVVRQLEGLHGGRSPIDWSGPRQRSAEILSACFEVSTQDDDLIRKLEGVDYEVGGDEHHLVRIDALPERVFKITHDDAFGCYSRFLPGDPDLTGRHFYGSVNDDPVFYLRRWMLLNFLGGAQTRFEGFLPPQENLLLHRICVSQPFLEGPNPTRREIQNRLANFGFRKISEDTFLQAGTGILLTDAAPRNVRIVEGIPVPFDAIAMWASDRILAWAGHQSDV